MLHVALTTQLQLERRHILIQSLCDIVDSVFTRVGRTIPRERIYYEPISSRPVMIMNYLINK